MSALAERSRGCRKMEYASVLRSRSKPAWRGGVVAAGNIGDFASLAFAATQEAPYAAFYGSFGRNKRLFRHNGLSVNYALSCGHIGQVDGQLQRKSIMKNASNDMNPHHGRKRVVIEEVQPQIDSGRYPVKQVLGDSVTVTAAVFGDGHDHVAGRLLYRHASENKWRSTHLTPLTNDLWSATFTVDKLGEWQYTIE